MTVHDIAVKTLSGQDASLGDLTGTTILVVNVASQCGLTPQYAGLQRLHDQYSKRGFAVVGFPCNQFGAQEPGDAAEIANFCSLTYEVDFPMMRKIDVNGPKTHPLYAYLKHAKAGLLGTEGVKWNFTKFLVDRKGEVVERFAPNVTPKALEGAIEALL